MRRGEALIAALFVGCIVLLALGVPVAFALGGGTLLAILVHGGLPLVALPKYLFSGIDVFALMAVPFFILTAELMTGGALSEVLLRFASQFVGRFRGGLGHTNILAITFFSGISGSALADAAGPGGHHDPDDEERWLPRRVRGGADGRGVDSGSDHSTVDHHDHLRARLPGSQSRGIDGRRRVAGPCDRARDGDHQSRGLDPPQLPRRGRNAHLADYLRNTWRALPALVLPVLILGGIASGAFTPTEASVVAVFYALAAGRWIYRSLEWRMLPGILSRSALMTRRC